MQYKGGWSVAFQAHPLEGGIYAIFRKKGQTKKSQHQGSKTLMYPFKPLEKRTLADTWENQGACSNSQQKSLNI